MTTTSPRADLAIIGSGSAAASSSMTCKSSADLPKRASGSSLLRMSLVSLMTFCAASWLFQKVSPVIWDSSSANRWFNLGTSKKPPQVRDFVGGDRNLRTDDVEHPARIQKLEVRIQKGKQRHKLSTEVFWD